MKRFGDAVADNPDLKNSPQLESLRKTLLKEPLSFFASLRARLQADNDTRPESLARLASAAFDLGKLTDEIGDKQDAMRAYESALAIRERLACENPAVTAFASGLALSHHNLGFLAELRAVAWEPPRPEAATHPLPSTWRRETVSRTGIHTRFRGHFRVSAPRPSPGPSAVATVAVSTRPIDNTECVPSRCHIAA